MSETDIEAMTFEEAMAALESLVLRLERGDVPLEESIALYEQGAKLKKRCETKLKEAEAKVAAITLDSDGQPTGTTPVEGL
ncbi:MAG: exodeoxyribonuclease VII small subunit [Pseudomonadota bacterium]